MENQIIKPVVSVTEAASGYQQMVEFIKSVLRSGVDYGVVPGTDKPVLLKPGAEKLARFFGLSIRIPADLQKQIMDWTGEQYGEPFFYFEYTAQAVYGDRIVAECTASANSWEKKYRYRNRQLVCPECGQPTVYKSRQGGGWFCWQRKGGCGANFTANDERIISQDAGQIPNPDIYDLVNTLQKMAQKRAIVGAVLLAVNASEFFTQDIEDLSYEVVDVQPQPQPQPQSSQGQPGMTLEEAGAVMTSDGRTYGTLTRGELQRVKVAILKALKYDLTDTEKTNLEMKLKAVNILLANHE